ncbi:MAG: alpha/beta hydrolase, partial [Candidatus Eremiobacteraeota bacterium]|nr:alpha/beta hydrolase [Candidatus Eremiobacteraeota bacterium]
MSERRIVFDDGATTILEGWGSGGPAVLFLHGITSSRKSWQRTAGAMELAYTVYAYDQRGHGDAAHVTAPMSFERSVRDCAQVADAIPGGIDTLVGHSWGGAVALLAGLRLPVSRVVAIDPLFCYRGHDWAGRMRKDFGSVFEFEGAERERAILEQWADLAPADLDGKIHALRSMSFEPLVAIGRENGADDDKLDLRETIVNYPRPLLVMLADQKDSVVAAEDVEFIRRHGGRNVTVHVFEGAGHSLHRAAFDDFMRALNAFLSV